MTGGLDGSFVSRSEPETFEFGRRLATSLGVPARIFLFGDLGAGKTSLTRGIAAGYGVAPEEVSSPTFTLVNRYPGPVPVYHIDLYRIAPGETHELGLDEILDDPRTVVIVEWADRLGDLDRGPACRVSLSYVDEGTRRIEVREISGRRRGP